MKDNNTYTLMNTLMYDALRSAGVKEKDARAAAIEAARSDLRSVTLEYALNNLRSHVDSSMTELRGEMTELRSHVDGSFSNLQAMIAKETIKVIQDNHNNTNKNTNKILAGIGTAAIVLSVVIGYFS